MRQIKKWITMLLIVCFMLQCTACEPRHREDEDAQLALMEAVSWNNLDEIRKYAKEVNDINDLSIDGTWWNPILYAWQDGCLDRRMLECLLDCGVDVNFADPQGHTLLMCATGCDPGKYGSYAKRNGDPNQFLYILLEHGADVSLRDESGNSAMDYAAHEQVGSAYVVKLLQKYGAEIDEHTFSLAYYGSEEDRRYEEKIKSLYGYVSESRCFDYEKLNYLASELHGQGLSTELPPLVDAAIRGDSEEAAKLLSSDWAQLTEDEQRVVFFYTVYTGTPDVLKAILQDSSFSLEEVDGNDYTPLYISTLSGNLPMLEYLIENYSWDIEVCQDTLELAIWQLDYEAFQLLQTICPLSMCFEGISPYESDGINLMARFTEAPATTGDLDFLQMLFDAGFPLNEVTAWKITFQAAAGGQIPVIQYMMELGYPVENAKLDKQLGIETIFSTACYYGQIEMINFLAEHNVDMSTINESLSFAVSDGNLEVVQCLMELGADPNAKCSSGFTSLELAQIRGYDDIVILLQKAA